MTDDIIDELVWTFNFVIIAINFDVRHNYGIWIRRGLSFVLVVQVSSLLNDLLHLNERASIRSPNAEFDVHMYQII